MHHIQCNIRSYLFDQLSYILPDICKNDSAIELLFFKACTCNNYLCTVHETLEIYKHHNRYKLLLSSKFCESWAAHSQNREDLFLETKTTSIFFVGLEIFATATGQLK